MKEMSSPATGPFLILESEEEGRAALDVVRSLPPRKSAFESPLDIGTMRAQIEAQMAANK